MPFNEKTAWIMSSALLVAGVFYFYLVLSTTQSLGDIAPPLIPLVIVYTVLLVGLAVAGHIIAAVLAPKDANSQLDEREQRIMHRSSYLSSYVLGLGILLSLGLYLISYNGNLLFYAVFASFMLSQICEYIFQIIFYRTSV